MALNVNQDNFSAQKSKLEFGRFTLPRGLRKKIETLQKLNDIS
jgi:hypothetical protein